WATLPAGSGTSRLAAVQLKRLGDRIVPKWKGELLPGKPANLQPPALAPTTSDNICHIKSLGVGSDGSGFQNRLSWYKASLGMADWRDYRNMSDDNLDDMLKKFPSHTDYQAMVFEHQRRQKLKD